MAGGGRPGVPWVGLNAHRRAAAELALPITTTGWPAPAGKWLASTVSPTTESGWPRKACALVRPLAFSPVSPSARTPSTTAVVIHTILGRGAMARPTRAHTPRVVGSAEPEACPTGQKTHRPTLTHKAGNKEAIASRATAYASATAGPK